MIAPLCVGKLATIHKYDAALLEHLIEHDPILEHSYRLLRDECTNDDLRPFGVIASGDNGAFAFFLDGVPVIVHRLREGSEFPVQFVVYASDGKTLSMTVDPPDKA